tara:strand:- start:438 stop:905 length:468 start_codon:yes stop_codon:yes gene_type:complete
MERQARMRAHELPIHTEVCRLINDAQTGMLPGYPESAICVQRFDDSLNSAIHTTYRNWLRSSSMHEPRDPPLEVVTFSFRLAREQSNTGEHKCDKKSHGLVAQWGRAIERAIDHLKRQALPLLLGTIHSGVVERQTVMILPQVHLRKPCYDFYFL